MKKVYLKPATEYTLVDCLNNDSIVGIECYGNKSFVFWDDNNYGACNMSHLRAWGMETKGSLKEFVKGVMEEKPNTSVYLFKTGKELLDWLAE